MKVIQEHSHVVFVKHLHVIDSLHSNAVVVLLTSPLHTSLLDLNDSPIINIKQMPG